MIKSIADKVKAGYSGLYLTSYEEARVEGDIATVAKQLGFKLHAWSITKGVTDCKTGMSQEGTDDPLKALDYFEQMPEKSILLMRDFHFFCGMDNPMMIRRIKECLHTGHNSNRVLIVLGCVLKLVPELEKEFTVIEVKLPDREQLLDVAQTIAKSAGIELNGGTEALLDAASGLTTLEAADAMSLAAVESGGKDLPAAVVAREKAATLKKNGLIEIIDVKVNRASVGGLTRIMPWIDKRVAAFSKEAREYGLPTPKGFLGIGIPGCGKSLVAKVTASILGLPLLKLDAGKLFGSLVGASEQNMRSVIQTAEAIAPAVLWIDEIEKGLGGSKSSGQTDGGTAGRVFGTFLQWMQEKTAPVFVVATANDITSLPPEFQRKGRFDEVWFFDLPTIEERIDIWKIQIQKYGRKLKNYDLQELAASTEGWTGSEIEALVVEALYAAFDEDGSEPNTPLLVALSKDVVPLSKTMATQVDALREWAKGKARRASEASPRQQLQRTHVLCRSGVRPPNISITAQENEVCSDSTKAGPEKAHHMNEIKVTLRRGQIYTWEDQNTGSTITWSIIDALEILGDRQPDFHMPPEAQRKALQSNHLSCDLDEVYARTTDLTKPLIAVISPVEVVPGKLVLLIIDGWHRIKHSVLVNNQTPLPVNVLLPHEEEACRIAAVNIQPLTPPPNEPPTSLPPETPRAKSPM